MKTLTKTLTAAFVWSLLLLCASRGGAAAAQTPSSPTPTPPPPIASRVEPTPHPVRAIEDPAARAGWTRYQFGDAPAFSVLLPARPNANARSIASADAPNAVTHLYLAEGASTIYSAQRMDGLSTDMGRAPESARRGLFDIFIKGFTESFRDEMRRGGLDFELELRATKKVTAAGRDAFEQDFAYGPLDGRAQVVFAGRGVFSVVAVWSREQGAAADRETFFKSFRLGPAPR